MCIIKILFIISVILVLIFLYAPLEIYLIFNKRNNNIDSKIQFSFFMDILRLTIDIPSIKIINKNESLYIEISNMIKSNIKKKDIPINKSEMPLKGLSNIYKKRYILKSSSRYLFKKIVLTNLTWRTEFGLEDAALTGLVNGYLWIFKSFILSYLLNNKLLEKFEVNIKPLYGQNMLNIDLNCIIKLKLVYIINAGILILKDMLKGGEQSV